MLVRATPSFLLTQDQSTIISETDIVIYKADDLTTPFYKTSIKVISKAKEEKELLSFWTANDGEALKEESALLLTESISALVGIVEDKAKTPSTNDAFKTVRYSEGGTQKFERGQILAESCGHMLIKTLRGSLLLVSRGCETR